MKITGICSRCERVCEAIRYDCGKLPQLPDEQLVSKCCHEYVVDEHGSILFIEDAYDKDQ